MSAKTEMIYTVQGMTCGHCEKAVRERVEEVPHVTSVKADRATGRLVVVGEGIADAAVKAAVDEAGYRVVA